MPVVAALRSRWSFRGFIDNILFSGRHFRMSLSPLLIILLVIFGGLALLAVVLFLWGMGVYNGLITLRNRYKNAYSQIDVQLKRRYDLIPNLVETAKGYMKHESETLEAVVKARSLAVGAGQKAAADPGNPDAIKNLQGAESQLSGALSRLLMVSEAYPDLKANQNMLAIQEELTSTENKIAFARQAYNDSVMGYNTQREVFPSNLIAGFFNFAAAALFEVDSPEEKQAVKVKF